MSRMFTGIIEELGIIKEIKRGSQSSVLTISCQEVLADTKVGDSIAVNGVCLTVTALGKEAFTADVMAETMRRSSLSAIQIGTRVNLERAMPVNGRFGGHIVSGHIEGTGKIAAISREDNAVWYTIEADSSILRYVVEKGSIAIDGISLTVAYVNDTVFQVSIIPHTQKETDLADKNVHALVNLETDILARYAEKLWATARTETKSNITEEFLIRNGF